LLVYFFTFAREAVGAAGTRHSLRPLISRAVHSSTRAPRAAGTRMLVIASEAKQSRLSWPWNYGLLRFARNDGELAV
jgi:hypothetical protein